MNIFDGQNGASDGSHNGNSQEIIGEGQYVNIFVSGTFGGASVTIQKFVYSSNAFADTAAVFTDADVFQDLSVKPGDRYRLNITGKSSTTSIVAEVSK